MPAADTPGEMAASKVTKHVHTAPPSEPRSCISDWESLSRIPWKAAVREGTVSSRRAHVVQVGKHVDDVQGFLEAARGSIAHSALRSEVEERPGDPDPTSGCIVGRCWKKDLRSPFRGMDERVLDRVARRGGPRAFSKGWGRPFSLTYLTEGSARRSWGRQDSNLRPKDHASQLERVSRDVWTPWRVRLGEVVGTCRRL